MVDSLDSEEGNQLREIEEKSFLEFAKEEVENETGQWVGSKVQNRLADNKISSSIKQSFKNYEKTRGSETTSYFKF